MLFCLINRMPFHTSQKISPFQHIFKRPPDYSLVRVFGCICFPHLCPYNSYKMDFRSTPCIFLGYSPLHYDYRCLDLSSKRIYIVHHVRFDETPFTFAKTNMSTSSPISSSSQYTSMVSPHEMHNIHRSLTLIDPQPSV